MRKSEGFFIIYELICFTLTVLLLLCSARALSATWAAQERMLRLEEGWQAAELAAAGEGYDEGYRAERTRGELVTEVRVYAGRRSEAQCNLLLAEE
jgi:hypothetical protein